MMERCLQVVVSSSQQLHKRREECLYVERFVMSGVVASTRSGYCERVEEAMKTTNRIDKRCSREQYARHEQDIQESLLGHRRASSWGCSGNNRYDKC
jgi:hypothetical protein